MVEGPSQGSHKATGAKAVQHEYVRLVDAYGEDGKYKCGSRIVIAWIGIVIMRIHGVRQLRIARAAHGRGGRSSHRVSSPCTPQPPGPRRVVMVNG